MNLINISNIIFLFLPFFLAIIEILFFKEKKFSKFLKTITSQTNIDKSR
jgi:hypothetical protein